MDRPLVKLAAVAALSLLPLVNACMPETPKTELSWDVDDSIPAQHRASTSTPPAAASSGPRIYAYQDNNDEPTGLPMPTPRPAYASAYAPSHDYGGGSVAFAWPVNGRVITGFGETMGGERNDGINIATHMNTPIHAAASGTVSYAGDGLKGYGNLVLIKHTDGYVTAYAHADRLLVNRGDFVAKGQVIGYSGQTGDVASPQLHFEIRHDTTPVDPRNLLITKAGA